MQKVYSVGQVNRYVKNVFTQDYFLSRISVSGEVSNCKYHQSGHIYFSLKDATGVLACVMFASSRRGLSFRMKDGDKVIVTGSINVYERDGRYQMYAREIALEGAGILYERFLALKNELEEMGMFDPSYKKPIPAYVKRLGVVTAPTGAAIQDIRNIALRRNPYVQIILYPALVQGAAAAPSIVRGLKMMDRMGVDVIIVGRGGGSIEDLWAFNEESVASAIFGCSTPVISAVGHETDFTIADFVADLRAPTPSAAAELAVGNLASVIERLSVTKGRLDQAMQAQIEKRMALLEQMRVRLRYLSPQNRLREEMQHTDQLEERLRTAMENRMKEESHRLALYAGRLDALSPLKKLQQGYAFVSDESGKGLKSITQVKYGDPVDIAVTDGRIRARVEKIETGREEIE